MYQNSSNLVLGTSNYSNLNNKFMEWCHQCKQRSNNVIHCGQGCNKKFCSRCLLRHYGEQDKDINIETWQCPFCKKICCCAYCRRNKDKLLTNNANSLSTNSIIGNSSFASNKNPYRKLSAYTMKSDNPLKRDRDEDYLNEEYDEEYDHSDGDEDEAVHMMKRQQMGYPMNNMNNNMNNMNTNINNNARVMNANVNMQTWNNQPNQSLLNERLLGPPPNPSYFSTIDPILDSKLAGPSSFASTISVPVALRVVPVQDKIPTDESYEWNSNKEEWMGNLFSHDLDRHDYSALVEYPVKAEVSFSPRDNSGPVSGLGSQQNSYKPLTSNTNTNAISAQIQASPPRAYQTLNQPQMPYYGNSSAGPNNNVIYKANPYYKDDSKLSDSMGKKNSGNRNSKKPIDYDSDYEYPDDDDQREQNYYIPSEPKLEMTNNHNTHKTTAKTAHIVSNYNYNQYGNYPHQQHHDSFQPDHDFHQRQIDVKRSRLPAHAVSVLKEWFYKHSHSPYPTEEEKEKFTRELSLTILQVNNWFTNARRRLLPDRV